MASKASEQDPGPRGTGRASPLRWAVHLLLVAGIGIAGWQLLLPALHASRVRAEVDIVGTEARTLFEAFERYFERNQEYPNAYAEPALEPDTLEPLRRRGYYGGHVATKLLAGRVDAYDSPDDKGVNQEFWLEMTLRSDPSIRFLIANSNDAPIGGGKWREGAFLLRDGVLESL